MTHILLQKSTVIKNQLRTDLPEFRAGSVVDVHYRIVEGNKTRTQVYSGVVVSRSGGSSIDATFTVLKVASGGIKVYRTFPLHSPSIVKIVVTTLQRAKRSKLYFLGDLKDPIKSIKGKPVKVKK